MSGVAIYQSEGGAVDVRFDGDTVWLSLQQMADLFGRDKSVITSHLRNVFTEGALELPSVVAKNATTAADGKTYQVDFFNIDAILSVYPPQYRQSTDAAVESVTVTLFNAKRPSHWDEVSDWVDRYGSIANADVVRITGLDTLKASKLLTLWRDQGVLVPLPGRGKRNMAYAKPGGSDLEVGLLSGTEDNNE